MHASGRYAEEDGSIPASFQVIYLTGWGPAASQVQPLPRGAGKIEGTISLKDLNLPDVRDGGSGS